MTEGKRVVLEFTMRIAASSRDIFPLLCPVAEYQWVPHWQCEMHFSRSGKAELGCVFSTDFGDDFGREVWVVSHFETERNITFVRSGGRRTTRYEIILSADGDSTNILWRQEMTALDEAGEQLLGACSEKKYFEQMTHLEKLLSHYLKTGKALAADAK